MKPRRVVRPQDIPELADPERGPVGVLNHYNAQRAAQGAIPAPRDRMASIREGFALGVFWGGLGLFWVAALVGAHAVFEWLR